MATDSQARREIRAFKKFAPNYPLPIDLNSIQKKEPPEPDILCCLEDGTKIAFELVELIDKSLAKRTFNAINLNRTFDEHFEKLPSDRKAQFHQKYGNAWIHIAFKDKIPVIRCRRSIPKIFEFLITLDNQAEGEYTFSSHNVLDKTVRCINISRGVVGPCFDVKNVGFFAEPACKRIKDKFTKQYCVQSIVELLAYYELQPELPKNHWLPSVKHLSEANLENSMFYRVWIYSVTQDKILYVYPESFVSKLDRPFGKKGQ